MDFKEEDFPLYTHIAATAPDKAFMAIEGFKAAVAGGDQEKFEFAMGIQTLAVMHHFNQMTIEGVTPAMIEKTLQSCLVIFKNLAAQGHEKAVFMTKYFEDNNLGRPSRAKNNGWRKPRF